MTRVAITLFDNSLECASSGPRRAPTKRHPNGARGHARVSRLAHRRANPGSREAPADFRLVGLTVAHGLASWLRYVRGLKPTVRGITSPSAHTSAESIPGPFGAG